MEKPGVEVGLLFRRVAGRVIDQTGGTQRPEVLVRLATEYYLAEPPASIVLAAAPAPAPETALAAPVDVQPVAPSIVAAGPSAPDVTARDTARQAALAADQPDAADRAALWGYMAALTESPFEVPVTQWVAPERATVAEAEPNDSFGAAQPVNPNDELAVTIGQNGDTDWFRVQVLQGGTLTVRAADAPGRPRCRRPPAQRQRRGAGLLGHRPASGRRALRRVRPPPPRHLLAAVRRQQQRRLVHRRLRGRPELRRPARRL